MKIESAVLLNELQQIVTKVSTTAKEWKNIALGQLNRRPAPDKWSALECIEHLNLYGDFYLPEIENRLLANKFPVDSNAVFKSGWLGNYFAGLMKAAPNGKIKKMASPKDKDPSRQKLTITTLDRFIKQLETLQLLLMQASKNDLTKTRTAISISPFIKLRLGDTFRFLIYHIERHMLQAGKALEK